MVMKTVNVRKETWNTLAVMKEGGNFQSLDELIRTLIEFKTGVKVAVQEVSRGRPRKPVEKGAVSPSEQTNSEAPSQPGESKPVEQLRVLNDVVPENTEVKPQ